MLTRLAALMVVAGLGAGFVLRIVLGRRWFANLAALALLPLLVHALIFAITGHRGGVAWQNTALFAVAAVLVASLGAFLARRAVARSRPWLAAFLPLLAAAAYGVAPALFYGLVSRQVGLSLDVVPLVGYLMATLFATCLLLPFVPPPPPAGPRRPG